MNKKLRNIILGTLGSLYFFGVPSFVLSREAQEQRESINGFLPIERDNVLEFECSSGPGGLLLVDEGKDGSLDFWINAYCGFRWGGAASASVGDPELERFQPLYSKLFKAYKQRKTEVE